MYKNHTIRNLIISSVLMILIVFTFIFLFNIVNNKNKHTKAVLNTLAVKMAKKDNIQNTRKEIEEINKIQNTINSYFVDITKIDSFIDYIEDIGVNMNIKVKVESLEPLPKDKTILSARASFSGGFSNVINTLLLLENAPYNIYITKISLDKNTESTSTIDKDGKEVKIKNDLWRANVSFNVMAL